MMMLSAFAQKEKWPHLDIIYAQYHVAGSHSSVSKR